MRKTLYIPLVILFLAIICMATQCRKDELIPSNYFTEKINIFPEQKIYHIGDTIWLQHLNASNTLFDSHSNKYFSADTVGIQFRFLLYSYPVTNSPNEFFDFILNGINVGQNFDQWFGCNNVSFNFKAGLVLKKDGIYSIDFSNSSQVNPCSGMYIAGVGFPPSYIAYKVHVASTNNDIYNSLTPAQRFHPEDYISQAVNNKCIYFFKVE